MKRAFRLEGELWRDAAACAGKPGDWWFTVSGWNNHGSRICQVCPVIGECEDYRIEHRLEGGWGGVYVDPKRRRKDTA